MIRLLAAAALVLAGCARCPGVEDAYRQSLRLVHGPSGCPASLDATSTLVAPDGCWQELEHHDNCGLGIGRYCEDGTELRYLLLDYDGTLRGSLLITTPRGECLYDITAEVP